MSERQKTSVVIDPDLWQQVRVAAVTRGVDRADAIEEGLRMWMGRPPSDNDVLSGLAPKQKELMSRLADVLRCEDYTQQQRDDLATAVSTLVRLVTRTRDK